MSRFLNHYLCLLGRIALSEGDSAAARPLYERALRTKENSLGHQFETTDCSASFARVLAELGDTSAAEALILRATEAGEEAPGANDPRIQRFKTIYSSILTRTARAPSQCR